MDARGVGRLLAPLARAVQMMVGRGVVAGVAARKMQALQLRLLADEVKDGVEHFEPYGWTSHPLAGAEAVVVFVGGDRSHGVAAVVADRRWRPTDLEPGEVAVFTDQGDEIRIRRGGTIRIRAATKLRIETPLLEVTGEVRDRCDADGRTMEEMRQVYNGHTHPEPDGGTGAPAQEM